MSIENQAVTDNDLLAYVDGQLDPGRRELVDAYLAEHPDKAAEVAQWQRQNEAIQALFAPVASEPVPPDLSVHAISRNARQRRQNIWRMAAAAVVLIGIGAGLGYGLRDTVTRTSAATDQLIASAVNAHELFVVQRRHPVEVAASDAPHLTTWLSNSLRRPLVAPDLSTLGYQLVGGRLLPGGVAPAAQIMYETGDGDRITLYITPRQPGDQGADKLTVADGVSALYWATDTITCTIVGNLSGTRMQQIAATVFPALAGASTSLDPSYRRG